MGTAKPLTNRDVVRILREIAALLEIKGENRYRILAYQRAADAIEHLGRDLHTLWQEGRLDEIPGVGEAIAAKIDELFRTGRLEYLERLEREYPRTLIELLDVPDLGPKRVRTLYEQLGITTLDELEQAARDGKLRTLPGFGAKTEAKILEGIQRLRRRSDRTLLGVALPRALDIVQTLREQVGSALVEIELAGSLRRRKATIGDMDIVAAAHDPDAVMEAFAALPQVAEVLWRGSTKTRVRLHTGDEVDLRVVAPERWGTALQYFTGSQAHNVRLREMALAQGLSLSEYSFKREDGSEILCAREEEVYATLGLAWIPPELREDWGEIEAARTGTLPRLVTLDDIRGDLHMHTTASDGRLSLREMVEGARRHGYAYIAITDHSQSLGMVNGLDVERLRAQRAEIRALQAEYDDILILQGAEVEIKADGTLDYPDDVLAELDIVIASLHTALRQPREQITQRLLNAIRNPHVDIIGHPTGRLLLKRDGADLDMDAVLQAAAETGTVLEINASPERLDLDPVYVRQAIARGCLLAIDTDAHHTDDFANMQYGVWQARRGWAEARHILNTRSREAFEAWLASRRAS